MTITVHMLDEAESALRDKADAAGLSLEQFAHRVLEREIGLESGPAEPAAPREEAPAFEMVTRVHSMPPGAFTGMKRTQQ